MKFQAIVTPNGLISSLDGPYEGRVNDWAMYKASPAPRRLERIMNRPNRRRLFLYGDSAYNMSYAVMAPYKHYLGHRYLRSELAEFNRRLLAARISVEHGFGKTGRLFTYNTFGRQLYTGKQAVGAFFISSVLLTNCHTCLNKRNQTADRYQISPPLLEEYLCLSDNNSEGTESL